MLGCRIPCSSDVYLKSSRYIKVVVIVVITGRGSAARVTVDVPVEGSDLIQLDIRGEVYRRA